MVTYEFTPQESTASIVYLVKATENDEVIANIKDELKNMFYKNKKHVANTTKTPKKVKKAICNTPNNIAVDENDNITISHSNNEEDCDYICETNLFLQQNKKRNKINYSKPLSK